MIADALVENELRALRKERDSLAEALCVRENECAAKDAEIEKICRARAEDCEHLSELTQQLAAKDAEIARLQSRLNLAENAINVFESERIERDAEIARLRDFAGRIIIYRVEGEDKVFLRFGENASISFPSDSAKATTLLKIESARCSVIAGEGESRRRTEAWNDMVPLPYTGEDGK